jgi:hypothetical protein
VQQRLPEPRAGVERQVEPGDALAEAPRLRQEREAPGQRVVRAPAGCVRLAEARAERGDPAETGMVERRRR